MGPWDREDGFGHFVENEDFSKSGTVVESPVHSPQLSLPLVKSVRAFDPSSDRIHHASSTFP